VCGRDVYLPQHYSAWQLTGSCPDALAVLASHSMGQCLLTWTMQMMWYSLHRIQAGGRQNSSVSTTQQTPWDCTLCGKKTKLQNTGYGPPPQSVSVDASWTDTQRGNGFVVASLGHDATLQCSIALHRNNRIKLN